MSRQKSLSQKQLRVFVKGTYRKTDPACTYLYCLKNEHCIINKLLSLLQRVEEEFN